MRASKAVRVVVCLCLESLCFSPFTTRTENRYDASEACVFAGDFGVGSDFAVVCLSRTADVKRRTTGVDGSGSAMD